jgi:DNA polymerase-3 subunit epsilon
VPPPRWVTGPLVGFDIETTGLDRELDEPVSYAFVSFDRGAVVAIDQGYVRPVRPISAGAAAVHGLTSRRLRRLGARDLDAAGRHLGARLAALSAEGVPVVGCNLAYDLTIVDRVLTRLAAPSSLRDVGWAGPVLDVLVLDRGIDPDVEGRPQRRLDALCAHYGVAVPDHTAAGDAAAAVRVLLAQADRHEALARTGVGDLQTSQAAWHATWCLERALRHGQPGDQLALFDAGEAWPYLERAVAHRA